MKKETIENPENVNADEPVDTINTVESVSATETLADVLISLAKRSRVASSLVFLQQTPKWALIAVPALAVALGGTAA